MLFVVIISSGMNVRVFFPLELRVKLIHTRRDDVAGASSSSSSFFPSLLSLREREREKERSDPSLLLVVTRLLLCCIIRYQLVTDTCKRASFSLSFYFFLFSPPPYFHSLSFFFAFPAWMEILLFRQGRKFSI